MRERTSKSIRFQKVCVTTYLLRKMDLEMLPHLKKLFLNKLIIIARRASFSRSSITGKSIFIAWLSTVDCKYFIVLFQTLRCILWWDRGRGSQHPHRVGFVFQDPVLRSEHSKNKGKFTTLTLMCDEERLLRMQTNLKTLKTITDQLLQMTDV